MLRIILVGSIVMRCVIKRPAGVYVADTEKEVEG